MTTGKDVLINWWGRLPRVPGDGPMAVVDGGGTHCRVALCERDGEVLAYALGGPTNARAVGDELALESLVDTLRRALSAARLDSSALGLCVVTSASVDTVRHADRMAGGVAAGAVPGGHVVVVPDTLGCWAVTNDLGPAVAVIAGTGSVVMAGDRDRDTWRRLGGWDYVLGDEGSGFGLGRAALREALRVSEGRSDAQSLADAVLRAFKVQDADEIPDAVHKPSVDKARIAGLAAEVLRLAAQGDSFAIEVMRDEIAPLAEATAAGLSALGGRAKLGLFGGAFSSGVYRAEFEAAVRKLSPGCPAVPVIDRPGLVGAYMIASVVRGDGDSVASRGTARFEHAITAIGASR